MPALLTSENQPPILGFCIRADKLLFAAALLSDVNKCICTQSDHARLELMDVVRITAAYCCTHIGTTFTR